RACVLDGMIRRWTFTTTWIRANECPTSRRTSVFLSATERATRVDWSFETWAIPTGLRLTAQGSRVQQPWADRRTPFGVTAPSSSFAIQRKYPHSAALGPKRNSPLQHHQQPVRKADQKVNVNPYPQHPRYHPDEAKRVEIGYREGAAYDREISFVPIPERRGRSLPPNTPADNRSNILALLDRGLSDARQQRWVPPCAKEIATRRDDRCGVSNCEYVGMTGH